MADNVRIEEVVDPGELVAADEIGGAKFQRIKLIHGADGVNAGDVSATNPLPVEDTVFKMSGTFRDAFGRLRVSSLLVDGFKSFEYGYDSIFFEKVVNGAGSVAGIANESALEVTTGGGASGDYAKVATRKFHRYVPGRSQLIRWTGVFGKPTANVRQRCGYYSDRDGLFLEYDGLTLYLVRRTSTSGVAVDTRVERSAWDDPMDGTGPSGLTLNVNNGESFLAWIDLEWLGTGRYRFGFASPETGEFITCHSDVGAGVLYLPYMATASLPVRFEVENTGAAANEVRMKWFCYSVDSEGGASAFHVNHFSVDSSFTCKAIPNGSFTPVLGLRAKQYFSGSVSNRGQILVSAINVLNSGNNSIVIRSVLNPTTLTQNGSPVTWVDAGNLAQYARFTAAGDTVDGGSVLESEYVPATVQSKASLLSEVFRDIPLVYSELESQQDVLVIEAAGIGGTSNALAALEFRELF